MNEFSARPYQRYLEEGFAQAGRGRRGAGRDEAVPHPSRGSAESRPRRWF